MGNWNKRRELVESGQILVNGEPLCDQDKEAYLTHIDTTECNISNCALYDRQELQEPAVKATLERRVLAQKRHAEEASSDAGKRRRFLGAEEEQEIASNPQISATSLGQQLGVSRHVINQVRYRLNQTSAFQMRGRLRGDERENAQTLATEIIGQNLRGDALALKLLSASHAQGNLETSSTGIHLGCPAQPHCCL
jgi:hypothetical protein